MDPANVFSSSKTVQERADRKIIMGDRVSHLHDNEIAELFGFQFSTVYPSTIAFTGRKVLQDILPFLLDPAEQVLSCRCNIITEDLAAEPALLTQLIFDLFLGHGYIQYFLPCPISVSALRRKLPAGSDNIPDLMNSITQFDVKKRTAPHILSIPAAYTNRTWAISRGL
jgi:hypothetical protein